MSTRQSELGKNKKYKPSKNEKKKNKRYDYE